MHIISTLNLDTRSTGDVPILVLGLAKPDGTIESKKFVARPTLYTELKSTVQRAFHLPPDTRLVFGTSTLDACRGDWVEIDESAYAFLFKFLDEVTFRIVSDDETGGREAASSGTSSSSLALNSVPSATSVERPSSAHNGRLRQDKDAQIEEPDQAAFAITSSQRKSTSRQEIIRVQSVHPATTPDPATPSNVAKTTAKPKSHQHEHEPQPEPEITPAPVGSTHRLKASVPPTAPKAPTPKLAVQPTPKPKPKARQPVSNSEPEPDVAEIEIFEPPTSKLKPKSKSKFKPNRPDPLPEPEPEPAPVFAPELEPELAPVGEAEGEQVEGPVYDDDVYEEARHKAEDYEVKRRGGQEKEGEGSKSAGGREEEDDEDFWRFGSKEPAALSASSSLGSKSSKGKKRDTAAAAAALKPEPVEEEEQELEDARASLRKKKKSSGRELRARLSEIDASHLPSATTRHSLVPNDTPRNRTHNTPAAANTPRAADTTSNTTTIRADERFAVTIEGPCSDQAAEFKTRGKHGVRKVLASVCKTFNVDPERARLVLVVEEDGEEAMYICNPEETMEMCGVRPDSHLLLQVEDYEEEAEEEEEEEEEYDDD
ncbi:hypothetical protein DXG03_001360 [Asterophora parasitica]|uniref:Uncharacterized protein n=1 Tax=Asterophora parasitica TaxID=117018 RepID=A0A9P7KBL5_9AGAR|nr:hypothetical protein DXG03_001360 [Asterophora parasitica]